MKSRVAGHSKVETVFLSKLIDVVISAGAVQGFFIGIVLMVRSTRRRRANIILAALLMVLSLSIVHSLLATLLLANSHRIHEPFILVIGPLLSLYLYELTGIRRIGWKDSVHAVPFLLFIAVLVARPAIMPAAVGDFLEHDELSVSKALWALIVLQFGYYWWRMVADLRRLKVAVESEFSNTEGKTLTWMHFFLHVFGMFLMVLVATVVIAFHTSWFGIIDTIVCAGLSVSVFALGYGGLFQGEVFSETGPPPEWQPAGSPQESLPAKTGPRPAINEELLAKLRTHIETVKPYLNESLTLTELARQLGTTRNQLSFLINSVYGGNFYSYINTLRVEEMKRLMADPKNDRFTILSLAYEAGFPSKSSFHTIFKSQTGQTPAEYRKNLR